MNFMKSTITKTTYRAIYKLLDLVSPVDFDCGILCGAACCLCDYEPEDIEYTAAGDENADKYMGLMLLPGEEKVFDDSDDEWISWGSLLAEDYDYPESWHGRVPFIQCRTAPLCKRNKRPIQCRTFPLSPHIDEDGIFHIIVCVKQVPAGAQAKLDPVTKTLVRSAGASILNPYDSFAVEAALQIRDTLDRRAGEASADDAGSTVHGWRMSTFRYG